MNILDGHVKRSIAAGPILYPGGSESAPFGGLLNGAEQAGARGLFSVYIVALVLLPSGRMFGLNLKVMIFLPLAFFAVQILLRQKDALYQLAVGLSLPAVFMGWVALARVYSFNSVGLSLYQYRDLVTTFAGCWFIRLFTLQRADLRRFLRLCIYAVAFGGLVKLSILAYALRAGVSVSTIMQGISRIFGVHFMTFDIGGMGLRIQFASDTMVPVCLFAVFAVRQRLGIGRLSSAAVVALLLASTAFTFSRFLWIYAAVGMTVGAVASPRDRMHVWYLGATAALVAWNSRIIATIVGLRFSSGVVGSSDSVRIIERAALIKFFKDAPLLGHGLGSYTSLVIRDYDLPYVYEMQVVALAGQVGVIGMLVLIAVLFNYYRKALSFQRSGRRYEVAVLAMLLCFLAAGFFNPCLVSSIAAATFGLLFALASFGRPDGDAGLVAGAAASRKRDASLTLA